MASTISLTNLRARMAKAIGDYISSTVTTALAASKSVVDTSLANVKGGGTDDYFNNYYRVLITSLANIGENRLISDYVASTTTLTVQGNNFASDTASKATYELHQINPADYTNAINQAARELYPYLFRRLRERTLVMGNILPNSHFEDWTSASYPDYYSLTNATCGASSTAGLYYGGAYSARVTASAANGYLYISSNTYPRLLDLMNKSVTLHCMAKPQTANDAAIVIYTLSRDGSTTQTLTSSDTTAAATWGLLTLESQKLNDNLAQIDIRFKVATSGQYVDFDKAWLYSGDTHEIMLPNNFINGQLFTVRRQRYGHHNYIADDVGWETDYEEIFGWKIKQDGTYKYLELPYVQTPRSLELEGNVPLETLSAETDTVTLIDPYISLLVAQAIANLYVILRSTPSAEAQELYDREYIRWQNEADRLKRRIPMRKPMSRPIAWSL